MTDRCPDPSLWPRLLDGDLPERDAHAWHLHAGGCSLCQKRLQETAQLLAAVATPVVGADERRVQRLMRRLDAATPIRTIRARALPWVLAGVVTLVGSGAWLRAADYPGTFTARGAPVRWTAKAHAEIRPLASAGQPWGKDAQLPAAAPLTVWYRNLETQRPLYLLAYLVDGGGEVHWVAPVLSATRPAEIQRLPWAEGAALMPESFVPESPLAGDGQLITVISDRPLNVEVVETAALNLRAAAETLFSEAVVWRQPVNIQLEKP